MTGLGAGLSGFPVFEAATEPGGICSSYYMRPGTTERMPEAPSSGDAYRFEVGGGHWIFGGEPAVLRLIRSLAAVKSYERKASIWFPKNQMFVPYPLQNHLRCLGPDLAKTCLAEIVNGVAFPTRSSTMAEWLRASFGPTLCSLFFNPFHRLYTANLWEQIAPQDGYKSPLDLGSVVQGAFNLPPAAGYNINFIYPVEGLNVLAQRLARCCDIRYGKCVVRIDAAQREVHFSDGFSVRYDALLSTLPLNRMVEMTGLKTDSVPDPSPSVLVINMGAEQGPRCPDAHWVYVPHSDAGFHRVGFYSNVDRSFLPASSKESGRRVSVYVEKAYSEGTCPSASELTLLCKKVIEELRSWEWIGSVEVVDPTWIEVAYTWSWAESHWRREAIGLLEANGIYQVGRYARWVFQGIADSIRDGLTAGTAMAACGLARSMETSALALVDPV